jgi:DNA (cytosine-5)-methyltransferase 1
MKFKGLSLFANVGIAETYLKDIGFSVVLANELLEERSKFYSEMHHHDIICGDINDSNVYQNIIQKAKELNVNFILATPPCQGMSIAGKMDENDSRNTLIIKAMQAFQDLLPEFMLIENVPQMFKTSILVHGKAILIKNYIQEIVEKLNYNVKFDIFDAADYGTPQSRKRSFTRIFKKNYQWNDPQKQKWMTVEEAIGDLPSLEAGESSTISYHYAPKHNFNHIVWMKHTPTGKSAFDNLIYYPQKDGRKIKGFTTTYKRISWDKPSPTITMSNGSISSQNNVHPGRLLPDGTYSDARVLSLLEIFRLTGLPKEWNPPKWARDTLIRNVIGEAIPPRLVENIFKGIQKIT